MTFPEMKRLNVISDFETKVDRALMNEWYAFSLSAHGFVGVAVAADVELNGKEKEYIVKHYSMRKSYSCAFVRHGELTNPKPGFKFNDAYADLHRNLSNNPGCSDNDEYFIVFRARW